LEKYLLKVNPKLKPALEPSFTVSFVSDENQQIKGSANTPNLIFCPLSPDSETTTSTAVRIIVLKAALFPFIFIDLKYYLKFSSKISRL
jgi:hypothetical protein